MSNSQRYYWLKLKENFFEDDTISWIEEQESGKDYILFYLKLCLKSIKTDGRLIRTIGNMIVSYDIKKLAEITNTDFDTAVVAMELFKKTGLAEVLDSGEIYLTKLDKMVASESESTERVRRHRNRTKSLPLQCNANVTVDPLQCNANVTVDPLQCNADVTVDPLQCNADVTVDPLQCNADEVNSTIDSVDTVDTIKSINTINNTGDYNIYNNKHKYNNINNNKYIYNNSLNNSLSCANFNQSSHTENQSDLLFNRFWQSYPRKVDKRKAQKAFEKLKVTESLLDKMLVQLERAKKTKQWNDIQYIPYPATWLNGKRWEDEIPDKDVLNDDDTRRTDKPNSTNPWNRGLVQ